MGEWYKVAVTPVAFRARDTGTQCQAKRRGGGRWGGVEGRAGREVADYEEFKHLVFMLVVRRSVNGSFLWNGRARLGSFSNACGNSFGQGCGLMCVALGAPAHANSWTRNRTHSCTRAHAFSHVHA